MGVGVLMAIILALLAPFIVKIYNVSLIVREDAMKSYGFMEFSCYHAFITEF